MADFSSIVDHLTASGLAIACLYIVFRQWQADVRIHQREVDTRISALTSAVSNLGSQVNTLARIVAQHEKDRV